MDKIFDAIIVGAGPAGCACATWLQQLGLSPLLIDAHQTCGGMQLQSPYTNTWIPSSYNVSSRDVAAAMHQNVLALKVPHYLEASAQAATKTADGYSVEILKKDGSKQKVSGKYLVLAGGIVPKAGGMTDSADVFVGATPRLAAARFRNKKVAILGGGDSAFENYPFVKEAGAQSATIFTRSRPRARMQMQAAVPREDVVQGTFVCDTEKKTVNGKPFDSILVMFGYEVSPAALLGLKPQLKPDGYILTDAACKTSIDRVYAIGEIAQRAHPCCVTAMADGVVAAKALQGLIEKEWIARGYQPEPAAVVQVK